MTATATKSKSSNSDKSTLGFIILAAAAAGGYFLWKKNSGNTEMIDLGGSGYALGGGSGLSDLSGYISDETGGGIIPESVTVPNAASEAATVPYYDYETTDGIDGLDTNGNFALSNLGATDKADMGISDLFTAEDLAEIKVSAATAGGLVGMGLLGKVATTVGKEIDDIPRLGERLLGFSSRKTLSEITTGGAIMPKERQIATGLKVGGKVLSRGAGLAGAALLASDVTDFLFGDFSVSLNKPIYSALGIGSANTETAAGNFYTSGKTIYSSNPLDMGLIPSLFGFENKSLINSVESVPNVIFSAGDVNALKSGLIIDYSTGAKPATATAKTDIKKDTMTVTETNIRNVDKKNNSYTADLSTGYTVGMANTSTSEMQDYFAKMNPETATAAQTQQAAVYGATVGSKYTKKAEQVNSSTGQTYSQMKSDYSSGKGVVTGEKNGVKTYQSTKVQTTPVKETYK